MLKGRWFFTFGIIVTLFVLSCAPAAPSPAPTPAAPSPAPTPTPIPKPVVLRLSAYLPPTHTLWTKVIVPVVKKAQELSQGFLRVELFPAEQLHKTKDALDVLQSGLTDIVYSSASYHPTEMPLGDITLLPTGSTNAVISSEAIWRLYKQNEVYRWSEYERHGLVLLGAGATSPYGIYTAKPFKSLGDLKGFKIRSVGAIASKCTELLGMVAVPLPVADTYLALERGTVDGVNLSALSLPAYGLAPLIKYAAPLSLSWGGPNGMLMMRKDRLEKLDPLVRKAIVDAFAECAELWGKSWDADVETATRELERQGTTFVKLSPEDEKAIVTKLSGVRGDWLSYAKGKVGDKEAESVMQDWLRILKELGVRTPE